MENRWLISVFVLIATLSICHSARILGIFSFPGASTFHFHKAILQSLHSAGHDITFVTPFAKELKSSKNFTVIDSSSGMPVFIGSESATEHAKKNVYERVNFLFTHEEKYCSEIMKLRVIKDALSSRLKFDVMFMQMLLIPECYLKLAEVLRIPVIGTVAFKQELPNIDMGNPLNPSIVPHTFSQSGRKMSFVDRLMNTWYYFLTYYIDDTTIHPKVTKFCRKHFSEQPALPKISPSLVFVNSHPSLIPRPMVPNFIEIAGIHISPPKPLSQTLQKFMDEAEHGVILFTFGSVIKPSGIPANIISAFVEVFASIPQRVIWKFDKPMENISENVMLLDWVPQRDILGHENVIAFISHCGLSGMIEAIYEEVPIVACPIFADQPANMLTLQELDVAVHLPLFTADKKQIRFALDKIINDTRYRENMRKLSQRFKDRPLKPEESVVYWTEYVIEHEGATHLRTIAADMPLYQYLMIDVFLLISSVTVIAAYFIYLIIKKLCYSKSKSKSSVKTE